MNIEQNWTYSIRRDMYIGARALEAEVKQCQQEGKSLESVADRLAKLRSLNLEESQNQPLAKEFLDLTAALPILPGFPYAEPSDLPSIRTARPAAVALPGLSLDREALLDKLHGAWAGRSCGCLLGKPVEGWLTSRLWGYLKDTRRFPLSDYFSLNVPDEIKEKYDLRPESAFIETVNYMPEDDDMDYPTVNLVLLKKCGKDFTPIDVATFWMDNIPITRFCTAERTAYRNFVLLLTPPETASYQNPYREWIGAQIRADLFGWISPGKPEQAAEFAWRDASISHVKNGIYGEMWVAGMLAAAFVTDDLDILLRSGLAQIPAKCRLAESIQQVMGWKAAGLDYDSAVTTFHQLWDENQRYDRVHVISNAMLVTMGLLWGELDFERSICRAVQPGFDTDCNGATVGSIVGTVLGAKRLPAKWTAPLHDTLQTGIAGYHLVKLADLAQQTLELI